MSWCRESINLKCQYDIFDHSVSFYQLSCISYALVSLFIYIYIIHLEMLHYVYQLVASFVCDIKCWENSGVQLVY